MLKCLFVWVFAFLAEGFYLPGIAPVSYCKVGHDNCKSDIPIYVNRLMSQQSAIPYDYSQFDFCSPKAQKSSPSANFGQALFGDRIRASPYQMKFGENEKCIHVCSKNYEKDDDFLKFLKHGMYYSYENRWIVDNMPISWCYNTLTSGRFCNPGFPIGCYVDHDGLSRDACVVSNRFQERDTYFVFNHVDITIKYRRDVTGPGARLVQATLEPKSLLNSHCESGPPVGIPAVFDKRVTINYSFSVKFVEDNTTNWASRWDYVLEVPHHRIMWFSLLNSLILLFFLIGLVMLIAVRLRKRVAGYREMDPETLFRNSFAWSFTQGEILRPPSHPMLLSALVGAGCHVVAVTFATLTFACLGFLSPASRGSFGTAVIFLFLCLAAVAGHVSARLYKYLGGENWKHNIMLTSFLLPLTICIIALVMDIIFRCLGSSAAIHYRTWLLLFGLWLGILVPMTIIGAYFGYKRQKIFTFDHYSNTTAPSLLDPDADEATADMSPVLTKIKQLAPNNIKPCRISVKAVFITTAANGILPFSTVFIPLFFIENALWSGQYCYLYGYFALVAMVLVLITAGSTIGNSYYCIAAENYRWWWRSFLSSGFTAVCVFSYTVHFYFNKLSMDGTASAMIYFGYSTIMALLVFLFTGSIGFASCLCFVRIVHNKSSQSFKSRSVLKVFHG